MVRMIEGEGYEAEVAKVVVTSEPEGDAVEHKIEWEGPYDPMGSYIVGLAGFYAADGKWFGPQEISTHRTRVETFNRLIAYAGFNDEGKIEFRDIPFIEYLDMVRLGSPRLYDLISGTDLEKEFPPSVDLGSTDGQGPLTWNPFDQIFRLTNDDVYKMAAKISEASSQSFVIPDETFLSLFFSDPDAFLHYNQVRHYEFGSPAFFAHSQGRRGVSFTITKNLPEFHTLFAMEYLEKAAEGGLTKFASMILDYERNFPNFPSRGEFGEEDKNILMGILKTRKPELFYGETD